MLETDAIRTRTEGAVSRALDRLPEDLRAAALAELRREAGQSAPASFAEWTLTVIATPVLAAVALLGLAFFACLVLKILSPENTGLFIDPDGGSFAFGYSLVRPAGSERLGVFAIPLFGTLGTFLTWAGVGGLVARWRARGSRQELSVRAGSPG